MDNKTCFFTGHRELPDADISYLSRRLEKEVLKLIIRGVTDFRAGGALGFDTLSALTVLKFKKYMPEVKLYLYLPCRDQAKSWRREDIKTYEDILSKANEVFYSQETYKNGCMHERNRCLAENSGYCICYLNKNSGGTFNTIQLAKKNGTKIIML